MPDPISYILDATVSNETLNALFAASWPAHEHRDFDAVLGRCLASVCAFRGEDLVGFVYAAWDGGVHAFLLDVTVLPAARRGGIGLELIRRLVARCRERGIVWLHVDYEAELAPFYAAAGFRHTHAGLIHLG